MGARRLEDVGEAPDEHAEDRQRDAGAGERDAEPRHWPGREPVGQPLGEPAALLDAGGGRSGRLAGVLLAGVLLVGVGPRILRILRVIWGLIGSAHDPQLRGTERPGLDGAATLWTIAFSRAGTAISGSCTPPGMSAGLRVPSGRKPAIS